MKDLSIYFSPVQLPETVISDSIGTTIQVYEETGFPELKKGSIALLYVPEFRNGMEQLHGQADERFRTYFYSYFSGSNWKAPLVDLGNLLPGERVEDTYFAIRQVTAELVKNQIIPIVIGGTQDLTYAMYQGYEELEQMINVMSIDYRLDLGDPEEPVSKDAFVNKLLMHRPCFLFNYAVLGYQTPLVKQVELDLFEKLYFDTVRLGEFNADFRVAEPMLRNTDLLSIDLQALRASDFKGEYYKEPNGFFNHEMCQLAKYAGISDKLTSIGIFNLLPGDLADSAHQEVAQLIWYFIDGVSLRVGDFPIGTKKSYTKFTVFLDEIDHEIVFFKSNLSERWWMEVPYPPIKGVKFERHHMVPCNKEDYEHALLGEIPNLWWRTYQKLG
jgi:formiminoglutamase